MADGLNKVVCSVHDWQGEGAAQCPYCWAGCAPIEGPRQPYRYRVGVAAGFEPSYPVVDDLKKDVIALCYNQEKAQLIVDALNLSLPLPERI